MVRFGADSELIERARTILGDRFETYDILSMICLDLATSLTNDPTYGVSKITGVSETRIFYREQWQQWHKTVSKESAYLDFPPVDRRFKAPPEALNGSDVIEKLLS